MTPDAKWALTAEKQIARLWDLHDTSKIRSYVLQIPEGSRDGETRSLECWKLSSDGQCALSDYIDYKDNQEWLWDLRDKNRIQLRIVVKGWGGWPIYSDLTYDGNWALFVYADGCAVLKDLHDQKKIKDYDLSIGCMPGPTHGYLSSDGKWAWIAVPGGNALWDLRNKKNIHDILTSKLGIEAVEYHAAIDAGDLELNGKWAIIVRGKSAYLHDLRDADKIHSYLLEGYTGNISAVELMPDGKWALTSSDDKTLRVWDLRDTNNIRSYMLEGFTGQIYSVKLISDGKWALTISDDKILRLWDLRDTNNIRSYMLHENIECMQVSSDGKWALTRSASDRTARFWDLSQHENS